MDATEHLSEYALFMQWMKRLSISLTCLEQHVDAIEKRTRRAKKRTTRKRAEIKEREKLS